MKPSSLKVSIFFILFFVGTSCSRSISRDSIDFDDPLNPKIPSEQGGYKKWITTIRSEKTIGGITEYKVNAVEEGFMTALDHKSGNRIMIDYPQDDFLSIITEDYPGNLSYYNADTGKKIYDGELKRNIWENKKGSWELQPSEKLQKIGRYRIQFIIPKNPRGYIKLEFLINTI